MTNLLNSKLQSTIEKCDFNASVISHTINDIATIRIDNGYKKVYVYLVYLDGDYRTYSISLDIVPSTVYDDIDIHNSENLAHREISIIKNIKAYLSGNLLIRKSKHLFLKYKTIELDIDGVPTEFKTSKVKPSNIDKIESAYRVELTSDLREYIETHRDTRLSDKLTWKSDPKLILDAQFKMFKDTLSFDIKEGDYWPKVFGEKPGSLEQSVEKALTYLRELPPLIPVEGLKFFALTQTSDPGMPTPVLSFEQFVDTIYAFGSIEDYLSNKRLDNETRQTIPRALGWENVVDGLGANDEDVYLSN